MVDTQMEVRPELMRAGRKVGYVIAIVVNLVMVVIVQNVLDWGWLPFLTPDFADVMPWITFSLIAAMVANTIYLLVSRPDVRSMGQIGLNVISLVVTYRMWQIFPFDFTGNQFDWTFIARFVLILAMVGSGVGVLTEVAKLSKGRVPRKEAVDDDLT